MTTWYCSDCLHSFTQDVDQCPNMACAQPRPDTGWGRLLGEGDLLDRHYAVERRLAVGGAGITYLAREVDPDGVPVEPWLAIKVLFAQRDEGAFLRRLANEAQLLQDLDHPNILVSYGFVHRRGHAPYLVTRFEHGGTLFDTVQRQGAFSLDAGVSVARQVLLALQQAHGRGVVHRDLKPQNVLLAERYPQQPAPHVRVADFGIAKVSGTFGEGMTQVGAFVGTPEYAAPEQFLGQDATGAADVFAWGGLLYYVLTGRHPVRFSQRRDIATSYMELLEQVPPSLEALDAPPAVRRDLAAVLAGVMAEQPAARWSIPRILEALDGLGRAPQRPASGDPPRAEALVDLDAFTGTMVGFEDPWMEHLPDPAVDTRADEPPVIEVEAEDVEEPLPPMRRGASRPVPARQAEEAPPAALPVLARAAPVAAPPPSRPAPTGRRRGLSLDDLFDFGLEEEEPEELPAPPPALPPQEASLFDAAAVEPAPGEAPPATSADGGPALGPDGTLWAPQEPLPLPQQLPRDPEPLLGLLGEVEPADRAEVVDALARIDAARLERALRDGARAREAAIRRGVGLCVAALQHGRAASGLRPLLADADPGVRACAAHATGAAGAVGALAGLSRLLQDPEAVVRAQAVLALSRAGRSHRREDMVRQWLDLVRRDAAPLVAFALERALRG
ncbi:MAG: serine/threonine protein kinase [Deltaproteobacteria bacterium]|nr:serine/threonine protein kinase [Deltaproteobacteria bacterium]